MKAPGVALAAPIDASGLMLATVRKRPFNDPAWLFEWKYDGFRCLVRKTGAAVELISRPGNSLNRSFPEIVDAVASIPGDFTWDSELTVDKASGHSSFERLLKRASTSVTSRVRAAAREYPARLYVFDMLSSKKRDLRSLPLLARKGILRDSFDDTSTLIYATGVVGIGDWVFEQVEAHDFEGMMAKRMDAPYQRGRSRDWLKIKYAGYGRPAALGFGHSKR
jgi:bifunctional non-homologous end joining protein LigD